MQIILTPLYTITKISVLLILLYFPITTFTTTITNMVVVVVVVVYKLYYPMSKNDDIQICMVHVCKSVPILGSDTRCSESWNVHRPIYLQESTRLLIVLLRQAVDWTVGVMGKNGVSADVWNRKPVVRFLASHVSVSLRRHPCRRRRRCCCCCCFCCCRCRCRCRRRRHCCCRRRQHPRYRRHYHQYHHNFHHFCVLLTLQIPLH